MEKETSFLTTLNEFGFAIYFFIIYGIIHFSKWIGSIILKFTAKKVKQEGIKIVAKEVAKEDDIQKVAKEVAKEVATELMGQYIDRVIKEAKELLDPIGKDIQSMKDDIKDLKKDNEYNKKEIELVRTQLKEYRESHHGTIETLHGVLNFTMDTLKDYKEILNKYDKQA